jgi:hypothetical protein
VPAKVDTSVAAIRAEQVADYAAAPSVAGNCLKSRDLGFVTSKHIKMYGERFELVSDPFVDGDCVAVQVIGGHDPTIRTVRLPVSILLGLSNRFRTLRD